MLGPGHLKLRLRLAFFESFRAAAALRGERLAGPGHARQRGAFGGEAVAGRGKRGEFGVVTCLFQ